MNIVGEFASLANLFWHFEDILDPELFEAARVAGAALNVLKSDRPRSRTKPIRRRFNDVPDHIVRGCTVSNTRAGITPSAQECPSLGWDRVGRTQHCLQSEVGGCR